MNDSNNIEFTQEEIDAAEAFMAEAERVGEPPTGLLAARHLRFESYASNTDRNKAKRLRRSRVIKGRQSNKPAPPRMRYYRPLGRKGKLTRLNKLEERRHGK